LRLKKYENVLDFIEKLKIITTLDHETGIITDNLFILLLIKNLKLFDANFLFKVYLKEPYLTQL
jgi:hypothetical protein